MGWSSYVTKIKPKTPSTYIDADAAQVETKQLITTIQRNNENHSRETIQDQERHTDTNKIQ